MLKIFKAGVSGLRELDGKHLRKEEFEAGVGKEPDGRCIPLQVTAGKALRKRAHHQMGTNGMALRDSNISVPAPSMKPVTCQYVYSLTFHS